MEKEVNFFDIETWGKLAENAASVGRKGRGVRVVGRLKQERWANTEGKQQSKVLIVAEHLEFRPEINPHKGPEKEAETSEIER
jgi:single-strand DNA-binding protein